MQRASSIQADTFSKTCTPDCPTQSGAACNVWCLYVHKSSEVDWQKLGGMLASRVVSHSLSFTKLRKVDAC